MYKNNQITSTKCQYHKVASNWKWWINEKWLFNDRKKDVDSIIIPIRTWRPWNPVVIKKIDP